VVSNQDLSSTLYILYLIQVLQAGKEPLVRVLLRIHSILVAGRYPAHPIARAHPHRWVRTLVQDLKRPGLCRHLIATRERLPPEGDSLRRRSQIMSLLFV
jgi:hypothetical protein